jgi:hypothetical protein
MHIYGLCDICRVRMSKFIVNIIDQKDETMNDTISKQMAAAVEQEDKAKTIEEVYVQTPDVVGQPVEEVTEPVII